MSGSTGCLDRVDGYGDWGMKPEALDAMAELVASLGEKRASAIRRSS